MPRTALALIGCLFALGTACDTWTPPEADPDYTFHSGFEYGIAESAFWPVVFYRNQRLSFSGSFVQGGSVYRFNRIEVDDPYVNSLTFEFFPGFETFVQGDTGANQGEFVISRLFQGFAAANRELFIIFIENTSLGSGRS